MEKEEKIRIIENAVSYSMHGSFKCLACDGLKFGASRTKVIVEALSEIGLTVDKVDKAIALADLIGDNRELGLSEGLMKNCIDVDEFLKVVNGML